MEKPSTFDGSRNKNIIKTIHPWFTMWPVLSDPPGMQVGRRTFRRSNTKLCDDLSSGTTAVRFINLR
jgi:hypothetical protein